MKTILAVLALCAFAPGALAAAPECRVIENANGAPVVLRRDVSSENGKARVLEKDPSRAVYKDPFIAEDARTNAKLKNICRGC